MSRYLIGCDWGTTGFRLRLTDSDNGAVVAAYQDQNGVAGVNRDYLKLIENQSIEDPITHRRNYFLNRIQSAISELEQRSTLKLSQVPVIISGMASSTIGMELLDYASIPFSLDGSDAIIKAVSGDLDNPVYLISGVATSSDVMRGEETQLMGLYQLLKDQTSAPDQLFILPGTHSKHIQVCDGKIIDFKTYLTGELFEILSKFSVLQYSVEADSTLFNADAFESGFRDAQAVSILNALFHVRTNQLFQKFSLEDNRSYLSGVIIGNEFLGLRNFSGKVLIAATPAVHNQYNLAMEISGQKDWIVIDTDVMESSAFAGQSVVFNLLRQGNFS